MNAVVGAGAMGAAMAMLHELAGLPTALLGTLFRTTFRTICAA